MKLWIIITLTGKIVGTIGPVPYGMDECLVRAEEKMAEVNSDTNKREVARSNDLHLRCEWHEMRPTLGGAQ